MKRKSFISAVLTIAVCIILSGCSGGKTGEDTAPESAQEESEEQERLLSEEDLEEEQESFQRMEEEAEQTLAEYTEGDTDLLNKKDNPALNGGGLRTDSSFFGNGRFD